MGRTKEQCEANVRATRKLLIDAGFLINYQKSQFDPSQHINFLGFEIDSTQMTVKLPIEKREKIVDLCDTLLNGESFTIRFVSKVIGTLVASLPAVEYGPLYYRYLEHGKIVALKRSAGNFDAYMTINPEANSELQWWLDNAHTCYKYINIPSPSLIITTDASLLGWGAVFNDCSTGGRWTEKESNSHINELELQAVNFGLRSFFTTTSKTHIRVRSDNMTAVTLSLIHI